MSKVITDHQPCPCGESSDAYAYYTDGEHCYSCSKHISYRDQESLSYHQTEEVIEETQRSYQVLPYRGHNLAALERYGVVLEVENEEPVRVRYTYPSGFHKFRNLAKKEFWIKGDTKAELFGQDKFSAGSAQAITVTEGEEDTLAAYEMLGSKWPVVSVQGSSSAKRDCKESYEYLNSFDRIYLCFDNDEVGQKAAHQVASLFPFNKIYVVSLTKFKDANDYLMAGAQSEFYRVWHNAKRLVPTNIISSFDEVEALLNKKDKHRLATFPFEGLQKATFGIRTGETYLFKAKEGIGKTEIFGAIEHHVLKTTDVNIAIMHLEDPDKRIVQRIANYELQVPVHIKELHDVSDADVFNAYKTAARRDHRVHIYESLENEDFDAVINKIRFLAAACDCKIVFLDHISRLVSGNISDDERRALDFISTRLSQLAKELDFALIMVTHVNDDGLTRGSRNISKEAWTVIDLDRDMTAMEEAVRNTTKLKIVKNRFAGITGPAGEIYFNPLTFTLSDERPEIPANLLGEPRATN